MVNRKTFMLQLVSGSWVLCTSGCGGGGGGDYGGGGGGTTTTPAATGCSATTISGNHGHTLSIPLADLSSTVAMTYSIQGTSDHAHQVTFSATQLAQLKAGTPVTVTSTTVNSHSHDVTESCT